jgi:hypothetical protein
MIENDESIASSSRFVTGKDGWDYAIDSNLIASPHHV